MTKGNTTFVAPFPKYPTPCPINIWSTMLYNELTSIDIMQGIENILISFPIFSFPNIFSSCSIFSSFLFFMYFSNLYIIYLLFTFVNYINDKILQFF